MAGSDMSAAWQIPEVERSGLTTIPPHDRRWEPEEHAVYTTASGPGWATPCLCHALWSLPG